MSISKKRIAEIINIKDENINYSDIPELDKSFWQKAEIEIPPKKQRITLRLDKEIIDWFRKKTEGKGYQTLINAVLKSFIRANK